jgi:MFS superfamily sulfate permease-like transporter
VLESIAAVWNAFLSLFDAIPEDAIAITVYVGGTLLALWAWHNLTRRLPSPLGGILWVMLFAILATPTISEGNNAGIAPAIIGLIFGVLTKEQHLILGNAAAILFVGGLSFLVGFCWSKYQAAKLSQTD